MSDEFDFGAAAAIRKVAEDWVVLRDSGRWEEFARVWHDDGWMTATWFQGPYAEFIAASESGFEHGVLIAHFLGGFSCAIAGARAVAQTKMKFEQRAVLDGVEVDVTCSGRFYDFLERRAGRWGIVRRTTRLGVGLAHHRPAPGTPPRARWPVGHIGRPVAADRGRTDGP